MVAKTTAPMPAFTWKLSDSGALTLFALIHNPQIIAVRRSSTVAMALMMVAVFIGLTPYLFVYNVTYQMIDKAISLCFVVYINTAIHVKGFFVKPGYLNGVKQLHCKDS